MIGTHNSLTGYSPKFWLFKWFNIFTKCQGKTLEDQYKAGVRYFDLRFAKIFGKWFAAHGLQIYNITANEVFETIHSLDTDSDPVYFRIVCENILYRNSDVKELCDHVLNMLSKNRDKFKLLSISSKQNWNFSYRFSTADNWANYDSNPKELNLAKKVQEMYELKTSDDKLNMIGCYSSGWGIPQFAARILTPITLQKKWKANDVPVVDFI
jgi:hypothetical protein